MTYHTAKDYFADTADTFSDPIKDMFEAQKKAHKSELLMVLRFKHPKQDYRYAADAQLVYGRDRKGFAVTHGNQPELAITFSDKNPNEELMAWRQLGRSHDPLFRKCKIEVVPLMDAFKAPRTIEKVA